MRFVGAAGTWVFEKIVSERDLDLKIGRLIFAPGGGNCNVELLYRAPILFKPTPFVENGTKLGMSNGLVGFASMGHRCLYCCSVVCVVDACIDVQLFGLCVCVVRRAGYRFGIDPR